MNDELDALDRYEIIRQFQNLLTKIWFWVLLKIYGDEIIVYFVLDAITLVFQLWNIEHDLRLLCLT